MEKVLVKAFVEGNGESEARRFYFLPNRQETTFQEFQNTLKEHFSALKSTPFFITWKDRDGDEVRIGSSEELYDAMVENKNILKSDIFKVIVETKGSSKGDKGETSTRYGDRQLHPDVMCDGCHGQVRGNRYKCVECEDFDLCAECEARDVHAGHTMLKIKTPILYDQPPFGSFIPPSVFPDAFGPPPFPFRTADPMHNTRSFPCRFTEIFSDDETGGRRESPSARKSSRRTKTPPASTYRSRKDPYYSSTHDPMYGSMYDTHPSFYASPYDSGFPPSRSPMFGMLPPPPPSSRYDRGVPSSPIPPPEILGLFAAMMDPMVWHWLGYLHETLTSSVKKSTVIGNRSEMEAGRRPWSANHKEGKEKKKKDKKHGKGKLGKKHKKIGRDSGSSKHKNRQHVIGRREEESDSDVEEVIEDLASATIEGKMNKKDDEESLRDYVVVSPVSELSEVVTPEQEVPTVEDVTSPASEKSSPSPMARQPQEVPTRPSAANTHPSFDKRVQDDKRTGSPYTVDELLSMPTQGFSSHSPLGGGLSGSEKIERPSYLPGVGMYSSPHEVGGVTLPPHQRPATGTYPSFTTSYVPTMGISGYMPTVGGANTYVPTMAGLNTYAPTVGGASSYTPTVGAVHLPSIGMGSHIYSTGASDPFSSTGVESHLPSYGLGIHSPTTGTESRLPSFSTSNYLSTPGSSIYTPSAGLSTSTSYGLSSHLSSPRHLASPGISSTSGLNQRIGSRLSTRAVGSHLPSARTGRSVPLSSSTLSSHRPSSKVGSFHPSSVGSYPSSVGGYPSSVGGYPSSVGGYPSSVGGYPSSVGGYPTSVSTAGVHPLSSSLGSYPSTASTTGLPGPSPLASSLYNTSQNSSNPVSPSSGVNHVSSQETNGNLSQKEIDSLPQASRINTLSHIKSQRLNDAYSPRSSYTPKRPEAPLSYTSLRPTAPATESSDQPNIQQESQGASHHDPRVEKSLKIMLDMGFTNEDGWLTQLLELKRGDIDQALEVLAPVTTK